MRPEGEQTSLLSKLKTGAKATAITTALLIPPALTAYWISILTGVRRYDANLSAPQWSGGPAGFELIACNALSNPADFQQWQSITNFLFTLNYVCMSQVTQSQLLLNLQSLCSRFKSSTPCDSANGGVTDNVNFCNTTSHYLSGDLATITCQNTPGGDEFVKYFMGPVAALVTLVLLINLGSVIFGSLCKNASSTSTTGRYTTFGSAPNADDAAPVVTTTADTTTALINDQHQTYSAA